MDLAIIILGWRFYEHLPSLLESISRQESRYRFVTVVCHNAAAEGPPSGFERSAVFPIPIHEIFTGGNLGYGGGNNFAISWARNNFNPRYFLVLNNDVILTDGALDAIVGWADANPRLAAVGAMQTDLRGANPSPYIGCRYSPALSLISRVRAGERRNIDYVNGACVLLRSEVFAAGQVFDESFFLFFEELELALRVKAMGYTTDCCPHCLVVHLEGATRDGVVADDYCPEVSEYFENMNALRFTRDHYPHCLPSVLIFRSLGKFVWLLARGKWKRLVFLYLAITDFLRGRVRRFPFQRGWSPKGGRERIVDAPMPC